MTSSQLIAWVMCLLLAFFATVLAIRNTGKVQLMEKLMEKQFAEATDTAQTQNEILAEIRDLLKDAEAEEHGETPEHNAAEH